MDIYADDPYASPDELNVAFLDRKLTLYEENLPVVLAEVLLKQAQDNYGYADYLSRPDLIVVDSQYKVSELAAEIIERLEELGKLEQS